MIDTEKLKKVVKGLEYCISDGTDCPENCPYIGDCNRKQLHNDAIDVLKAQERELRYRTPRKVEHTATIYKCCTCPSCGNVVDEFDKWGETYTRITTDYCKFCGQALDWSDEEKNDG